MRLWLGFASKVAGVACKVRCTHTHMWVVAWDGGMLSVGCWDKCNRCRAIRQVSLLLFIFIFLLDVVFGI